jgi:hypothetical protein
MDVRVLLVWIWKALILVGNVKSEESERAAIAMEILWKDFPAIIFD